MKKTCLSLLVIVAFCTFNANAGTLNVAVADTIKFGQYYIDKGEANYPLIQVREASKQERISALKNGKATLVEVKSGLFDKYPATAEIRTSNGKVEKTNGKNQFLITANKHKENLVELKVTHDLQGDVIYLKTREWTSKDKTNFTEKVERFTKWEQTVWLKVE